MNNHPSWYTGAPAHNDPKDPCLVCRGPQFRMHLCRECHANRTGFNRGPDFEWGIQVTREAIADALEKRARWFGQNIEHGDIIANALHNAAALIRAGRLP